MRDQLKLIRWEERDKEGLTLRKSHHNVVEDLGKVELSSESRALTEPSDGSLDHVVVVEGGEAVDNERAKLFSGAWSKGKEEGRRKELTRRRWTK